MTVICPRWRFVRASGERTYTQEIPGRATRLRFRRYHAPYRSSRKTWFNARYLSPRIYFLLGYFDSPNDFPFVHRQRIRVGNFEGSKYDLSKWDVNIYLPSSFRYTFWDKLKFISYNVSRITNSFGRWYVEGRYENRWQTQSSISML